eukprot:CAMPEP_0183357962 /NCGR_PEP_ID=MMETSP0164_2-20130417/47825_1 /TAXON_ID=221442 /ORGANISM="Coccolithus pelagicus ssp braarudi, Strain PLY182g" /LENGTH=322 /DNA_ID=CAMNT_0025531725 /DNA_START=235 /DNA_END=1200 /DNA_ORIENTATION=+
MNAVPAGAATVAVHGGRRYARFAPHGAPGLLTDVGWAQGVAVGRRLYARYGLPDDDGPEVRSTDISRTVLTARAVLTGLYEGKPVPNGLRIHVDTSPTMILDTTCTPLAETLIAGRAIHRESDVANGSARAAVAQSFGASYDPQICGLIAVHDDCIARRFAGLPPHAFVDVSLCDYASREAAREVRAALRHGDSLSAHLSAGPLCELLANRLSVFAASSPPNEAKGPVKLVLLSGHDTSLMMLLNALDPKGALVSDGVWPPHTSCIALELLDNGNIRVCYQWEPLLTMHLDGFVEKLRAIAGQPRIAVGVSSGAADGAVFRW